MKTNWNLKLFYDGVGDPRIKRDIKRDQEICSEFVERYRNKRFWASEQKLYCSLIDYEKLFEQFSSTRSLIYYFYKHSLDTSSSKIEAGINKLTDIYTKLENELLFFELNLGKVDEKLKKQYLKSERLKHYRYYLKHLFDESKHQLTEPEERILNCKAMPCRHLWTQGMDKLLNKQEVQHQLRKIPISQAISTISKLDTTARRTLHRKVMMKLKNISDFAESEINAVYIDKKIDDELRKFPKPYSATLLNYENTENEALNLVKAVSDNFSISHGFFSAKAKIFKLRRFKYADRAAEIQFKDAKFTFKKSVELMKKSYSQLGGKYLMIFESFLKNGQIDVYPKRNKEDGAFCSSSINNPTMVLLNHVDSAGSFRAFAHEMGHAFHSEFSKKQTPIYQDYSAVTAETASTLFEHISFDYILNELDEDEKKSALHNKLSEEIATVFRQIAFFNFELELHNKIRKTGFVSKEEIARLMNKHMLKYLGPRFNLDELDGYFFVCVPHLRDFFYVYSYAYGLLLSKIIFKRLKQDRGYLKEIEKFLSAGGSQSPHDIFAKIGIDTNDQKTWKEGLGVMREEIEKLESLIK